MSAMPDFDMPLAELPSLGRSAVRFERTHLEGATAEVRFLPIKGELTSDDAAQVWDGLGRSRLPILERQTMNMVSLTLTPTGHQQVQEHQPGWLLASSDRSFAVTLYPSMISVQTSRYDHYQVSLGDPLADVLRLLSAAVGAPRVNRIGLRFINRLTDTGATTPGFWADHVSAPFAGPMSGSLSQLVEATHQQTQLRLDQTASARVVAGVFREADPPSRYSYLIDLDVFREQAFEYDLTLIAGLAKQLDRTALALFTQIVSASHLDEMGPVAAEEAS